MKEEIKRLEKTSGRRKTDPDGTGKVNRAYPALYAAISGQTEKGRKPLDLYARKRIIRV